MNLVEELRWRELLHDAMPGTDELLMKEKVKGYVGFDPTADSLHVGNLVPVTLLMHLQRAGHFPIALVGGATGLIGDPSGKTAERNLLSVDLIQHNLDCQKRQLEQFLDFNSSINPAKILNNYDWFKDWNFLAFIRDIGKHISVNYMMAKDSVKNRLENGMSFTEFSYQLIQGYDFYYLYKNHGVKLQMGGSDQWGNITTGTELIRRIDGGEAYALTAPLLKKADGSKFGKSESGNVWLDANKTSPYKFYQFWLNIADEDAKRFVKIFTFSSQEEINQLIEQHHQAPHLRLLQKYIATDVTKRIHGENQLLTALKASEILFGNASIEMIKSLDDAAFTEVFEGVPGSEVAKTELEAGIPIIELLADKTGIFPSRGEARKMIQAGAVAINLSKIDNIESVINTDFLINRQYILVQKGKKNKYLIQVV
jgi:tyrosyl-tRNA synthetase